MTNPIRNNQTKPDQTQTTPLRPGGIGRGRVEIRSKADWKPPSNDLAPLTERRAKEFAWAEKHLPDQHPGLVVSALISLELAGETQSTKTVMARLHAQGRTAEQMKEKGWM